MPGLYSLWINNNRICIQLSQFLGDGVKAILNVRQISLAWLKFALQPFDRVDVAGDTGFFVSELSGVDKCHLGGRHGESARCGRRWNLWCCWLGCCCSWPGLSRS